MSLTTLMMERTRLQGEVPVALFSAPQLQTVILRHNQLNGTLDLGTSYSSYLKLVDLQSNSISEIKQRPRHDNNIVLVDNPVCQESGATGSYCTAPEPNVQYTTPFIDFAPTAYQADKISSPKCQCAYPYMGTVTWLEHMKVEDRPVHPIINQFVSSGVAFGAQRWLAVL
ncbi:hypothetical protein POM88_026025 [Heracleum sosnowskyi]|uniref:Uncharacterized protein n=1 Tax=Heracleum sosnowskyi TaxID=360622 RepID=A0AAD8I551_9APIA|nr:hypothetical protein POM88_026025 [Heracleum sosnowskyi]